MTTRHRARRAEVIDGVYVVTDAAHAPSAPQERHPPSTMDRAAFAWQRWNPAARATVYATLAATAACGLGLAAYHALRPYTAHLAAGLLIVACVYAYARGRKGNGNV